ncbi:MAG: alpha/beta hydrolase [Elusimicrobia bacterium]|nr:alpha/beta hydrolase [Elusimicrobiota bacterium]
MKLALLLLLWAVPLAAAPPAPAAGAATPAKKRRVLPGIVVELAARDGWRLKAKYVPPKDDNLTFLLLHAKGRRLEDWYVLGRKLANWGYGYLAPDFRGHGLSVVSPEGQTVRWKDFKITKTYNEFANMSMDVEAAVAYLAGQGVTEEGVAVIGAEVGSSIGLKYAAVRPQVPLVVMLSPGIRYQEVLTVNAMRAYKDRPILMVHSEEDKKSASETGLLRAFAKQSTGEANTTVLAVPGKERGTRMLNGALCQQILDWVVEPVRPADVLASSPTARAASPGGAQEPYPQAADDLTSPEDAEGTLP